jgi:hypothetical protein
MCYLVTFSLDSCLLGFKKTGLFKNRFAGLFFVGVTGLNRKINGKSHILFSLFHFYWSVLLFYILHSNI